MGVSINEHVQFVQLLNVRLDFRQFLLVAFLASLESGGVDEPNVRNFLVIAVDLVPLALEALSNVPNFFCGEAVSACHKCYLSSLLLAWRF
jgi:hypothetical protein